MTQTAFEEWYRSLNYEPSSYDDVRKAYNAALRHAAGICKGYEAHQGYVDTLFREGARNCAESIEAECDIPESKSYAG